MLAVIGQTLGPGHWAPAVDQPATPPLRPKEELLPMPQLLTAPPLVAATDELMAPTAASPPTPAAAAATNVAAPEATAASAVGVVGAGAAEPVAVPPTVTVAERPSGGSSWNLQVSADAVTSAPGQMPTAVEVQRGQGAKGDLLVYTTTASAAQKGAEGGEMYELGTATASLASSTSAAAGDSLLPTTAAAAAPGGLGSPSGSGQVVYLVDQPGASQVGAWGHYVRGDENWP